jgi:hypothetical protein
VFQRSDPVLPQSALHSRYRGRSNEPITARTDLYTCLCVQEFDTSHLPDQVRDQVARLATSSQGARQITGLLTEGPGPTSRPGSLPAPRVACHCSPAGFDRQQFAKGLRPNISNRPVLNLCLFHHGSGKILEWILSPGCQGLLKGMILFG